MKILLILIIINFISLNFTECQRTINLSATIYDHTPSRQADMEVKGSGPPGSVHEGVVLPNLNPITKLPTYCCGDSPILDLGRITIHNESTFNQWFVDLPGINIPIPYELVLTETGNDTGIFEFGTTFFFPIDGKGFDNKSEYPNEQTYYDVNGQARNFHFCMTIRSQFPYNGGEVFRFAGDDDVWIFFDNRLLVDIGSIHPMAERTAYLDDLPGLIPGNYYDFDMFYCERHTDNSDLIISANLNFVCPYYDVCGICRGKNDTCCRDACENADQCYIGICSVETNFDCIQIARDCNDNDSCTVDSCDPLQGCIGIPINCDDGDYCTLDNCDSILGCTHTEIENCRPCNPQECTTIDPCFPRECDPQLSGNCVTKEINCTIDDPCILSRCEDGECILDNICTIPPTDTPTVAPTDTPTVTPTDTPTVSPTVTPTDTPTPTPTSEPTLPPLPPPKGLHPNCLNCNNLNCDNNWCTYVRNPYWEAFGCKENCCKYIPTCYKKDRN